jgi:hypothetical protein
VLAEPQKQEAPPATQALREAPLATPKQGAAPRTERLIPVIIIGVLRRSMLRVAWSQAASE